MYSQSPIFKEGRWHLISSNSTGYKMGELLQYLYPNSIIEFEKNEVWIVDDGWNPMSPYTGQTINVNWNLYNSNLNLSPFYGYWVQVNSIYHITTLHNSTQVRMDNNKYVLNSQDGNAYNSRTKYGIKVGTYTFQSVSNSHPIAFVVPNCVSYEDNIYITYTGNSRANDVVYGVALDTHSYYYGDITLTVREPFSEYISIHCGKHGNMNGEHLLVFNS